MMTSPNSDTIGSYEKNADGYIDSRDPGQSLQYCQWIVDGLSKYPNTAKLFEVGTGTGYDADYLESLGYTVVRSDAAQSFIDFNEKRGKRTMKFDVTQDKLPEMYDAIVAVNVMQHLPAHEFKRAIKNIHAGLSVGGRFLFSITIGKGAEEWRDDKGGARYFLNWDINALRKVLVNSDFSVIYEKEIGYKNWVDIIVEKI